MLRTSALASKGLPILAPVPVSQSRTVPRTSRVASTLPSGLKARVVTHPKWGRRSGFDRPVAAFGARELDA